MTAPAVTAKTSSPDTAAAALPQTARGPQDWHQLALRVESRHRYRCGENDPNCNYDAPHWHGVACDHTCNCKGQ